MITGNRGDWSEIYALFKLLGDGHVFAGDADLNKIENLFYPIIKILRTEEGDDYDYKINGDIVVVSENDNEILRIAVTEFNRQAGALLTEIQNSVGSAFNIPETEKFMQAIKCKKLKAKSEDKTDIKIVIHDHRTGFRPLLGFSIKSQVGSPSTLINASSHTNLIYQIADSTINAADIERINSISTNSRIKDRVKEIENENGYLQFSRCDSDIFRNNLFLIDSYMPQIIAEIMKIFYSGRATRVNDIVEQLEGIDPLGFKKECVVNKNGKKINYKFYEYKVKRLLTDAALGMKPATPWTGVYEATGGYLIVKEDGEVLCYHIYSKNEFENYLYANTKLETPDPKRHKFGDLYEDEGKVYLKLNFQVRFTT